MVKYLHCLGRIFELFKSFLSNERCDKLKRECDKEKAEKLFEEPLRDLGDTERALEETLTTHYLQEKVQTFTYNCTK